MDEQIERKCDNCFFAIIEDHGYSDWTCEGSNVFCARDRHPVRNGFDRWYGEDKHLNYAKKCGIFLIGNPVHPKLNKSLRGMKMKNIMLI